MRRDTYIYIYEAMLFALYYMSTKDADQGKESMYQVLLAKQFPLKMPGQ